MTLSANAITTTDDGGSSEAALTDRGAVLSAIDSGTWIELQRDYWNRVAPEYDSLYTRRWCQLEDDQTVRSLDGFLPAGTPTVLDLGCGTGLGYQLCRSVRPGLSYLGRDLSTEMLARARRNWPEASFEHGTFTELSEHEDASFEGVIALYTTLSYSDRVADTLREAHRVLRPGGVLYASVLNRWSLRRLLRVRLGSQERYRTRYSRQQKIWAPARLTSKRRLTKLATGAGFSQVRVEGQGLLAGCLEAPALWTLDVRSSRLFPGLCNTLILMARRSPT